MARGLDAAEGGSGGGGQHLVDRDHAGFEIGDEAGFLRLFGSPHRRAEAERDVVGNGDGVVEVGGAEQHGDGAEQFLARKIAVAGQVGDNSGGDIGALARDKFAADEGRAGRLCLGQLRHQRVALLDARQRAHDVSGIGRVAQRDALHRGGEARGERVVNFGVDDHPLGADARLAIILDPARHGGGGGGGGGEGVKGSALSAGFDLFR